MPQSADLELNSPQVLSKQWGPGPETYQAYLTEVFQITALVFFHVFSFRVFVALHPAIRASAKTKSILIGLVF